jgi:hypothetical protein
VKNGYGTEEEACVLNGLEEPMKKEHRRQNPLGSK